MTSAVGPPPTPAMPGSDAAAVAPAPPPGDAAAAVGPRPKKTRLQKLKKSARRVFHNPKTKREVRMGVFFVCV